MALRVRKVSGLFEKQAPGQGYCVAVCSWARHFTRFSAFLHPGVQMGTGEFNAGGSPAIH